MNIVCCP